ncbi:MAG TPA: thioesterase family protein, partial [Polyangiaceae bacterium]
HSWTELGIHLPVVEAYVRYRKTARFDELLCVETRLSELARVRVRFDYRLLRAPEGRDPNELNGDAEIVAEGHTLFACVDRNHVPRRVPPEAEAILLGPELEHPGQLGNGHRPRPVTSPAAEGDAAVVVPLASVKP